MSKVICIVQGRMGSGRLPGKVMKPILGEPMISYTLRRLAKCRSISETVLATSVLEGDRVLAEYVKSIGFECFRGSEDDVLERYVTCNRKYGGDIVIRVTGDCPLIDPCLVDMTVDAFVQSNKDYLNLDVRGTAMLGFDTEVFSAEALERVYTIVNALEDKENFREHVTIYMYKHPQEFSVAKIPAGQDLFRPYRLCVDEEDDFALVKNIFEHFQNPYVGFREIVDYLDANPEVAKINNHVQQKKA